MIYLCVKNISLYTYFYQTAFANVTSYKNIIKKIKIDTGVLKHIYVQQLFEI